MSGNVLINFVAPNQPPGGTAKPLGTFLWQGFQAGARQAPPAQPTNLFFM